MSNDGLRVLAPPAQLTEHREKLVADRAHLARSRTLWRMRRTRVDWHCQSINLLGCFRTGRATRQRLPDGQV